MMPLIELDVDEVSFLLVSINLSNYCTKFKENQIDGRTLMYCKSVDDVIQLGINMRAKASLFFDDITKFKQSGVPLKIITPRFDDFEALSELTGSVTIVEFNR